MKLSCKFLARQDISVESLTQDNNEVFNYSIIIYCFVVLVCKSIENRTI